MDSKQQLGAGTLQINDTLRAIKHFEKSSKCVAETVTNLLDLNGVDVNKSASLQCSCCWWWSNSCCSWRRRFNVPRLPVTSANVVTFDEHEPVGESLAAPAFTDQTIHVTFALFLWRRLEKSHIIDQLVWIHISFSSNQRKCNTWGNSCHKLRSNC